MADKILATWWAICCGNGFVRYIFDEEKDVWFMIGTILYALLFAATLYQIKAKQSLVEWLWKRHKKRKAWKADPNNWSI
jgi:TRAP-type mannitol/chloroaromatic compound transport system permease small subunit